MENKVQFFLARRVECHTFNSILINIEIMSFAPNCEVTLM